MRTNRTEKHHGAAAPAYVTLLALSDAEAPPPRAKRAQSCLLSMRNTTYC